MGTGVDPVHLRHSSDVRHTGTSEVSKKYKPLRPTVSLSLLLAHTRLLWRLTPLWFSIFNKHAPLILNPHGFDSIMEAAHMRFRGTSPPPCLKVAYNFRKQDRLEGSILRASNFIDPDSSK
ncbi:hypothetical protein AMTR_s00027p00239720 [Amborella trichopoda]|uniref:Uncharacterized protein n=1 Tax=Amborella trichopoda TaxID=13333 RepID=W1PT01_AMBTC|nr:hypothetical protein AMTR_s00027p00239720 [Amborella trichopoda]